MAKYMIHAVPSRMWYVEQYLIPSMLAQGISDADIKVHCDYAKEKNLLACMHAFQEVDMSAMGTWHLQDDVIISHDFKEITEKYDDGFVCGFSSMYDGDVPSGVVSVQRMWFSFPCIRIPNTIAKGCADWVAKYIIGNIVYKDWWETGVNDDMLFRQYVWQHYSFERVRNLEPNIVDHVDYLIGGTVNSSKRGVIVRSTRWVDEYLVEQLQKELENKNALYGR